MAEAETDRRLLRDLAAQVAEIAALPVQQETVALWQALNRLQPVRPMVMIDQLPWHELDVDDELALRCEDPFCRGFEGQLRRTLYRWRHLPVDLVVEPCVEMGLAIRNTGFGLGVVEERRAIDERNAVVSHSYVDQLAAEGDVEQIRDPEISHDEAATARASERAREIFDGLLEVRVQGALPVYAPFDLIVQWRGAEPLIYDLADRPAHVHRIVDRLTAAQLRMLDQLEEQGLLGTHQPLIHCTGAFSDELPSPAERSPSSAKGLWTYGMSQIFSTVSPAMHEEFEGPALTAWFNRFGLAYYGCCEPLDRKLPMIRRLPGVRKISMSPWVEVERGASEIGGDFVFSRKPSPAFLAVDHWNPAAVEADLRETLAACARHGCPVELILKDVSTVRYQPQRLWEWAAVARRLVTA